jgi:hypothetical protein
VLVRDPEQQVLGQLLARPGPNHRRRSPSSLGWIEEDGGLLRLTADGEREHADLAT